MKIFRNSSTNFFENTIKIPLEILPRYSSKYLLRNFFGYFSKNFISSEFVKKVSKKLVEFLKVSLKEFPKKYLEDCLEESLKNSLGLEEIFEKAISGVILDEIPGGMP